MAGRRHYLKEESKFRIMRLLAQNPNISTRKLADEVGISNGSAFYLLTALIDKGFVKLENFRNSNEKKKYAYILTPRGVREKSKLTIDFLERKRYEFNYLKNEIKEVNFIYKTFFYLVGEERESSKILIKSDIYEFIEKFAEEEYINFEL